MTSTNQPANQPDVMNDQRDMNPAAARQAMRQAVEEMAERGAALIREAPGKATHLPAGGSMGADADPTKGQGSSTSQRGSQAVAAQCHYCPPGYRYGDEGCRHTPPMKILNDGPAVRPALRTELVLGEVAEERRAQDAKWGEQNHPDGTGGPVMRHDAEAMRFRCQFLAEHGGVDWRAILLEEVYEALAEDDPVKLRVELIQVAAVAVNWVEAIDRRPS